MFGTGESPSSSRESMTPSMTSSSCVVGTYCCHIGSPISLIVARAFGVIRIWKLSNAGWSPLTSMTSLPNRSANLSSVSTLSWRTFCQSLMVPRLQGSVVDVHCVFRLRETLRVDHPRVAGRVVVGDRRHGGVATDLVKAARRSIVVARRRLDDQQSRFPLT